VDLALERLAEDRLSLTGQLLHSRTPHLRNRQFHVLLLRGEQVLAHTMASGSGEFHLSFVQRGGLRLVLELPRGGGIAVELPEGGSLTPTQQQR
jgi:hypothetical protein